MAEALGPVPWNDGDWERLPGTVEEVLADPGPAERAAERSAAAQELVCGGTRLPDVRGARGRAQAARGHRRARRGLVGGRLPPRAGDRRARRHPAAGGERRRARGGRRGGAGRSARPRRRHGAAPGRPARGGPALSRRAARAAAALPASCARSSSRSRSRSVAASIRTSRPGCARSRRRESAQGHAVAKASTPPTSVRTGRSSSSSTGQVGRAHRAQLAEVLAPEQARRRGRGRVHGGRERGAAGHQVAHRLVHRQHAPGQRAVRQAHRAVAHRTGRPAELVLARRRAWRPRSRRSRGRSAGRPRGRRRRRTRPRGGRRRRSPARSRRLGRAPRRRGPGRAAASGGARCARASSPRRRGRSRRGRPRRRRPNARTRRRCRRSRGARSARRRRAARARASSSAPARPPPAALRARGSGARRWARSCAPGPEGREEGALEVHAGHEREARRSSRRRGRRRQRLGVGVDGEETRWAGRPPRRCAPAPRRRAGSPSTSAVRKSTPATPLMCTSTKPGTAVPAAGGAKAHLGDHAVLDCHVPLDELPVDERGSDSKSHGALLTGLYQPESLRAAGRLGVTANTDARRDARSRLGQERPGPSRSGRRAPGTCSTRAGRSRSSTPVLVLLAAGPAGPGPGRAARPGARRALALAAVLACFPFPLRGRALLWLALVLCVPLLEPWRAPALLAGRARRLGVLHGRGVGQRLLPPAHRRAVAERPALLAPGPHQLRPHERQRARAGAEARDARCPRARCWRRSRAPPRWLDRPGGGVCARARMARWRRFAARGCRATPRGRVARPRPRRAARAARLRDRGGRLRTASGSGRRTRR